ASIDYNDSANTVTFHLSTAVGPTYFTNVELLSITPLPIAWDLTAAGQKGTCSSEARAQQIASCPAVYSYLAGLAKDISSYAATSGPSAIWQVVDGPWKLASFNADGHIAFVPNPSYSGPTKPKVSRFQFAPFTDLSVSENVLRSNTSLSVGAMPTADLPQKP